MTDFLEKPADPENRMTDLEEKMSETYGSFATVYDSFMDDVPYEKWCEFITAALKSENIPDGLVLDLGCGTGRLTRLLADAGYDMIGVDNSPEMLDMAQQAGKNAGSIETSGKKTKTPEILYLCQDMREFELYGTVRAVVSACDCINYILDKRELKKVFTLVNNYLESRGAFIFDFHTEHYYKDVLADNVFADDREEAAFIWNNFFDAKRRLNEYDLTVFAKRDDNLYDRFTETHIQRAYTADEIEKLLTDVGMECVAMYDSYTRRKPGPNTERITVLAREKYQKGKHYE